MARKVPGAPASGTNKLVDALCNGIPEGGIYDPQTETAGKRPDEFARIFAGNLIPTTRFDPSSVKVQNLIPKANLGSGLVTNYLNPYQSTRLTPIPSLKLDHSLSDKLKASFYWSTNETSVAMCAQQCASIGYADVNDPKKISVIEPTRGTFIESYTLRANVDYTLRPTMLLHFGAGVLSNDFKDNGTTIGYDPLASLGIKGGHGASSIGRFPTFNQHAGNHPSFRGLRCLRWHEPRWVLVAKHVAAS